MSDVMQTLIDAADSPLKEIRHVSSFRTALKMAMQEILHGTEANAFRRLIGVPPVHVGGFAKSGRRGFTSFRVTVLWVSIPFVGG